MDELMIISEESDDQSSVKSDESCGSNRVKFLCRYGGRILPRPGDGKLRYAGGNTRVVAASRSIGFADLIAKMSKVFGSSVFLKCQLPSEDLDSLVSVKSDEDLKNMLEEYDRIGAREGLSKVRAFLFPLSVYLAKSSASCHAAVADRPSAGAVSVKSVKPQADPHVAVSNLHYQIPQWQNLQRIQYYPSHCSPPAQKNPINQFSTRELQPNQAHIAQISSKNGRPPRSTAVYSDLQYNSSFKYMNFDLRMKSPPQHKSLFLHQPLAARVVHRNNVPQVQVR